MSDDAMKVMAAKKHALEEAILRLCNRFERETGLVVSGLRHPREYGCLSGFSVLKPDERIEVGVTAPFPPFLRKYQ